MGDMSDLISLEGRRGLWKEYSGPGNGQVYPAKESRIIRRLLLTLDQKDGELELVRASAYPVLEAMHKIARMPIEPRPDGTHNYSREALIYIAREVLDV